MISLDPSELYFAQQHVATISLLGYRLKYVNTPHYKFLNGDTEAYDDYLQISWSYLKPRLNTAENRHAKARAFRALASAKSLPPITFCSFAGNTFVIDGNHRVAVALKRGCRVDAVELPVQEYLKSITTNDVDFYGSKHRGLPYQSVFYAGKELITGRRRDTLIRADMLEDMSGRVVVDIGCNIGASSILAAERGAATRGFDLSPRILTSAIRLNVLLGLDCRYEVADFGKPQPKRGDVALAFSVDRHIKNDQALASNLAHYGVVYFETHERGTVPDAIRQRFVHIEHIGTLRDRLLYRLSC